METTTRKAITVETTVEAPVERVWDCWNKPEHITQWNQASPDWHCPRSENDLREGGTFSATMAAKDGSFSFEFGGTYTKVEEYRRIEYTLGDGRKVQVKFAPQGQSTVVTETFEAEDTHSLEMQQAGWQAILDSFKRHTEREG